MKKEGKKRLEEGGDAERGKKSSEGRRRRTWEGSA